MTRVRMAPGDAAWLHMDRPDNELIVHAVLWFDEPLDDRLLRSVLTERLVQRHGPFRQRVEDDGRRAFWVDHDVELDAHLTREQLEAPGDRDALERHTNRLVAEPLPRDRPLWQITVLDGFGGGSALVARMHHCIADGVALFRVLLSLADEASLLDEAAANAGVVPPRPAPLRAAALAARALGTLLVLPPDRRTGLRQPLGTAKTVVWSEALPLDPLRGAARAAGGTLNDLFLAALAEALHAHQTGRGEPARDVRAAVPVNLRPLDRSGPELGNAFGLAFVRLPVTERPAERVAVSRRRTVALRSSAVAAVALWLLRVFGRAHRRVVQVVITVFSAKASVVVTNVPGPPVDLHLGGNRLAGIIAWPPQSGSIGVGCALISYAGNVVLGVMADDRLVPDPALLLRRTVAALGLGVPVASAPLEA